MARRARFRKLPGSGNGQLDLTTLDTLVCRHLGREFFQLRHGKREERRTKSFPVSISLSDPISRTIENLFELSATQAIVDDHLGRVLA